MNFETKANTLNNLINNVKNGRVLPQVNFTVRDWKNLDYLDIVFNSDLEWLDLSSPVIVRSSAQSEDSLVGSLAGHFESVLNVIGKEDLIKAIEVVAHSLKGGSLDDQIFIQPMLSLVKVSGVAFTRDPNNGGYYYVINYDDSGSGSTSSVTEGSSNDLSAYYHFKTLKYSKINWINDLLNLLQELEEKFNTDSLDVEFAIHDNTIFLLQVRPLILKNENNVCMSSQQQELTNIERHISSLEKPHPYLLGDRAIYGVMPDWNPAEIIGIRPRPLALSLYKELITDGVWAYQRDNYGYRNLRSFPLLYSFSGFPYIDIRVSFTSFIPRDLDANLAHRLVNYYLNYLSENPSYHDKVEFDVVYSCYTLDLPKRMLALKQYGFSDEDCSSIMSSLKNLTNSIIDDTNGLWKKDVSKIDELKIRHETIKNSSLSKVEKIYWLIEDCKRYGTLPFAGLARAGFIAVELLKSLVSVKVLSAEDYESFLGSVKSISSDMSEDLVNLNREEFIDKYGHLRPGTYEIRSSRYDRDFDTFFGSVNNKRNADCDNSFSLGLDAMNMLNSLLVEHNIKHSALSLLNFIKGAIEAREYAKFVFTRSLSDAMQLISELGNNIGFSDKDLSYLDIKDVMNLYSISHDLKDSLSKSIVSGRERYKITSGLQLPTLIISPKDVWSFVQLKNEPSFITLLSAKGHVVDINVLGEDLDGCILMIPSADPGYDWIFSRGISAFITMYGGVNSHMSIRASELGIPAVIGAGESLYHKWSSFSQLEVDCSNKKVIIIR